MPDADPPLQAAPLPTPTADLVERARAFRAAGEPPPPAVLSATVVIARDAVGGSGLEVFMLRRVAAMAFAGGMHVFPGGVVDHGDYGKDADVEHALAKAAVREVFEETGVLLAAPVSGAAALPRLEVLEGARRAVLARAISFDDALARHGLMLAADQLRSWSHWVTPEFERRRYDTRFFVAKMPPGQGAREVGGESDGVADWVRPVDALAAQERGDWLLMPPTEVTLREVACFDRAADVFAAAEHRHCVPIRTGIDLDADPPRFVLTEAPET